MLQDNADCTRCEGAIEAFQEDRSEGKVKFYERVIARLRLRAESSFSRKVEIDFVG